MDPSVRVAVVPQGAEIFRPAIEAGGAVPGLAENADAVVWTDPNDPAALRDVLASSPARWVQLPFAGVESFFDAGVIDPSRTWTCAKGIYGPACAELALGLVLAGARQLVAHARRTRWWSWDEEPMEHKRVRGSTALVVGTGGIGRAFAQIATPLGIRIVGVNRSGAAMPGAEDTHPVDALHDVIPEADWVVIAAALTPETYHLFDRTMIAAIRSDAWLINVARGGLVDTDALVEALRDGAIGGAGLDVTEPEPLPEGHPLWGFPNVVVTSHTANTWQMAVPELVALVERNVAHFVAGEPLEGVVDPALGY